MSDINRKVAARMMLLANARSRIYMMGESMDEWENDERVLRVARDAGIEHELTHISWLGKKPIARD